MPCSRPREHVGHPRRLLHQSSVELRRDHVSLCRRITLGFHHERHPTSSRRHNDERRKRSIAGDNPDTPDEVVGMDYISETGGQPIGKALQERFGESMASLFELAMKARLAVILYRPTAGDEMNAAMVEALTRAGTEAGLPESLWKDVPDKIANLATHEEVSKAVEALDENVTKALLADIGDVPGAQP